MEWILVTDENRHLYDKCWSPSSNSKTAMQCELPPRHWVVPYGPPSNQILEMYHFGRNRVGAWRSWPLTPEEDQDGRRTRRPDEKV